MAHKVSFMKTLMFLRNRRVRSHLRAVFTKGIINAMVKICTNTLNLNYSMKDFGYE